MNLRAATLPLLFALAHGCASTPRPQPSGPNGTGTPVGADGTARARAALAPPPPAPGCLSALPTLSEPAQGPFEIRASAPNSDIVVTGASDLPTGPASTQGAWTRSAEARLRAAGDSQATPPSARHGSARLTVRTNVCVGASGTPSNPATLCSIRS